MRNRLLIICYALITIFSCSPKINFFQQIIQTQLQRYPQMQIQDLYKLVYQATMGNIHLGIDPSILKSYLIEEMENVEASDNEHLVEDISVNGMIRVNLRPYKAKGGDPGKLFDAMMQTANTFNPDKNKIIQYWKVIERMAEENSIPFNKSELESFLKKMQTSDYAAVHHSDEYSESYNPAYRVILKQYLPCNGLDRIEK